MKPLSGGAASGLVDRLATFLQQPIGFVKPNTGS
jgi:hypothetical protein